MPVWTKSKGSRKEILFTLYIYIFFQWCDDHPRCKRIKLQGFLIKPLQRVTKYSLLLRAVISKTVNEEEQQMLDKMVSEKKPKKILSCLQIS